MKKSIFIALAMLSMSVFAQSINVYNGYVHSYNYRAIPNVQTLFFFDLESGQGYVDINVIESDFDRMDMDFYCDMGDCTGYRNNIGRDYDFGRDRDRIYVLLDTRTRIEGLSVADGILKYSDSEKTTICGDVGRTRFFRRVKLNLNGNCTLQTKLKNNKLDVRLKIK